MLGKMVLWVALFLTFLFGLAGILYAPIHTKIITMLLFWIPFLMCLALFFIYRYEKRKEKNNNG
jgi:cyanate permease